MPLTSKLHESFEALGGSDEGKRKEKKEKVFSNETEEKYFNVKNEKKHANASTVGDSRGSKRDERGDRREKKRFEIVKVKGEDGEGGRAVEVVGGVEEEFWPGDSSWHWSMLMNGVSSLFSSLHHLSFLLFIFSIFRFFFFFVSFLFFFSLFCPLFCPLSFFFFFLFFLHSVNFKY